MIEREYLKVGKYFTRSGFGMFIIGKVIINNKHTIACEIIFPEKDKGQIEGFNPDDLHRFDIEIIDKKDIGAIIKQFEPYIENEQEE